jgi:hypothetical protein
MVCKAGAASRPIPVGHGPRGNDRKDPSKIDQYTSQQQYYNQVVQQYRNVLLQHRQDTQSLNTAVGVRILP